MNIPITSREILAAVVGMLMYVVVMGVLPIIRIRVEKDDVVIEGPDGKEERIPLTDMEKYK